MTFHFRKIAVLFYFAVTFSSHTCLDTRLAVEMQEADDLPYAFRNNKELKEHRDFIEESFFAHFLSTTDQIIKHSIQSAIKIENGFVVRVELPPERLETIAKLTERRDLLFAGELPPHFYTAAAKSQWTRQTLPNNSIIESLSEFNPTAPPFVTYQNQAAAVFLNKLFPDRDVRIKTQVLPKDLGKDYLGILKSFESAEHMYESLRVLEIEAADFVITNIMEGSSAPSYANLKMQTSILEALARRGIKVADFPDLHTKLAANEPFVVAHTLAIAAEAIMQKRERRHGYGNANNPDERTWQFADEIFIQQEVWYLNVLGKNKMFLDLNFRDSERNLESTFGQHFATTHRLQWQSLMIQKELHPERFSARPLSEVFNSLGNVAYIQNLRHTEAEILYSEKDPEIREHFEWAEEVKKTGYSSQFPNGLWLTMFDNRKALNFTSPEAIQYMIHQADFKYLQAMEAVFAPKAKKQ